MHHTQLITTAQAAAIVDCTPANIRRLADREQLPIAVRVGRGQRLFDRRDVERLAAVRRRRTIKTLRRERRRP
jgi:DNA-binding transcriptional MerR regulator